MTVREFPTPPFSAHGAIRMQRTRRSVQRREVLVFPGRASVGKKTSAKTGTPTGICATPKTATDKNKEIHDRMEEQRKDMKRRAAWKEQDRTEKGDARADANRIREQEGQRA